MVSRPLPERPCEFRDVLPGEMFQPADTPGAIFRTRRGNELSDDARVIVRISQRLVRGPAPFWRVEPDQLFVLSPVGSTNDTFLQTSSADTATWRGRCYAMSADARGWIVSRHPAYQASGYCDVCGGAGWCLHDHADGDWLCVAPCLVCAILSPAEAAVAARHCGLPVSTAVPYVVEGSGSVIEEYRMVLRILRHPGERLTAESLQALLTSCVRPHCDAIHVEVAHVLPDPERLADPPRPRTRVVDIDPTT